MRTRALHTAIALTALLLAFAVSPSAHGNPLPQAARDTGDRVDVIISFFDGPDDVDIEDIRKLGGTVKYVYHIIPAIAASLPASALSRILSDGNAETVELDLTIYVDQSPNDPQYGDQWGLNNTGQAGGTPDADIDAPEAWNTTTGDSSVLVAIIDTGAQVARPAIGVPGCFSDPVSTHPDLAANLWTNPGEIPGDGIDNDGNGKIDDVHGWNFFDNADWLFCSSAEDEHGTHVAGTIAAVGNNGVGVTGVSWSASLMILKFIGPSGRFTSDAIAAIEYAADQGAQVINASWGGGSFNQALKSAIEACGCVFVAAAGNGGSDGVGDDNDSFPHYPSSYDSANLIAVAATDHNDSLASFSNFGNISVDLAAPGVSILSTVPFDGYDSFSGTSMATPHASGVAALVYSQFPGLTPAQVKDRILSGVDPVPGLSGVTVTGGRLNAANALTSGPTPGITVSPVSGLVTTEGGGTDSFTVVLDSEPTADVAIGVSSSDLGEGTVSTTTLTFTPANWSTAQTVTVTGVDDSVDDGDIVYTIVTAPATGAAEYVGIDADDVSVTNTDDDVSAGILLSDDFNRPNSSTVGQGWVEVEQSSATVSISGNRLYFGDTSDATNRPMVRRSFATVSAGTVEWQFDFDWKWDRAEKTYRLFMQLGDGAQMSDNAQDTGVGVNLIWTKIGGVNQTLAHRNSGSNTGLAEVSGAATLRIVADLAAHTYDVYIDGILIQALVPFDNLVSLDTVRFFTDALNEKHFSGQAFDNVEISVASSGPGPTPGITVSPTSGLVTTEAGGTDAFTVVLDSEPTDNVTIGISSSNVGEGTVSTTTLTFTSANWNTAQTVTVTGVDDDVDDGDIGYSVVTAPATGAAEYAGIDPDDVSVTNTDDDGSSAILLSDDFNRPNSSTVGQDWVEVEQSGASVSISGNTLYFGDTSDATNRPLVRRSFAAVSTGTVVWQFDFDWTRSGSENTYRLFMQLGDGAQMSDGDQDAGVGVNLIWTQIGGAHESLGHRASGTNTALVQVSGTATVKIVADLAAHTYDVYIDGALIQSLVPFDNLVSLDTVRFFTDALNEKNFSGQAFDNVELILASA